METLRGKWPQLQFIVEPEEKTTYAELSNLGFKWNADFIYFT